MQSLKMENPELWELCMKHGTILAKNEHITQVAILAMYDEILELFRRTNGNIQQQLQPDSD
jgi:hypothetical protein